MNIEIRKSFHEDVENIMPLFFVARKTMANLGIDQWQNGYPTAEIIHNDIDNKVSFAVIDKEKDKIIATFAAIPFGEIDYDAIYDGFWITDSGAVGEKAKKQNKYACLGNVEKVEKNELEEKTKDKKDISYLTIHRITVSPEYRGGKITEKIFDFASEIALNNKLKSVRIDTHRGNIPMRKCLEKNGFVHCGSIYLSSDGKHRVAYEKVIQ